MTRGIAVVLCGAASRLLPVARGSWGDAMTAELSYIESDDAALSYACGCVLTALRERAYDFDTRFAAGLWSVAIATSFFAALQLICAVRGVRALLGGPDRILDGLVHAYGANSSSVAGYEMARPIVIGCFFALSFSQFVAAWLLSRAEFHRFVIVWCMTLVVATVAVTLQLSIIWNLTGVPSEFYGLVVQSLALSALLSWSNGRHRRLRIIT